MPADDDDQDTPARSLQIQLLTSDCVQDAPFVNYTIMRGLQMAAIAVLLGGFALLVTRRRRPVN